MGGKPAETMLSGLMRPFAVVWREQIEDLVVRTFKLPEDAVADLR
jgi:hypothetical protein